jgi:hypothetical protein
MVNIVRNGWSTSIGIGGQLRSEYATSIPARSEHHPDPGRSRATFLWAARGKCLFLYFYFMDRDFGLIHVKLQTWFPMQIQVYVHGHEWLARKLTSNQIRFSKRENAFIWIEDWKRAQKLADRFANLNWPRILERYGLCVNPLLKDLLHGCQHYWVTAQSEYSTDILFKSTSDLQELYPKLLSHSMLCFGAKEVMSFLGRKLTGHFEGEIVSDMNAGVWRRRLPGARVQTSCERELADNVRKVRFDSSGRDGY